MHLADDRTTITSSSTRSNFFRHKTKTITNTNRREIFDPHRTYLHRSINPGTTPKMPSTDTWTGVSRLILGSTSWSRSHLLRTLNPPQFETLAPNIDESSITAPTPQTLVISIALAKARALLPRIKSTPSTYLIVGDSVVTHKSSILGKPESEQHARQILTSYATAPATTVSSVIVVDVHKCLYWADISEAEVYFRPFPEDVIETLVKSGGAMQSAGGLRIEHPAVERYTDCIIGEKSAVMGFSTSLCERLIKEAVSGIGGNQI